MLTQYFLHTKEDTLIRPKDTTYVKEMKKAYKLRINVLLP